ncbi:MAG: aromatic ring-hydroxylating dioxygenase subunit alpha [Sphingobium sp.]|nr:aromatic ring-hydroxylating dioxygenase subunit alpha [Sphingobium sp.]
MDSAHAFPRNAWYMAAWGNEVGETLLRRRLLGEPMLLFRKEDGSIAAMIDRCPHRFAPLSLGTRSGDTVTCPYHGLTFDAAGTCIRNPFSETIPKGTQVATFPAIERDGIVWFWPGDAEAADPSRIPDFSMLFVEGHGAPISGLMPMNANFQYGTDNLLDLSHIEFVHKGSFAGRGVIFAGEHSVREDGDTIHSDWWMPDIAAPSHTLGIYDPQMRCDHWLDMRWNAPASMCLEIGGCPHGAERKSGVIVHQAHILTPETVDATHYFWATTRTMPPSEQGDAMLFDLMSQAFSEEDKPIIEATYANMDGADFWDRKPAFLGIDAGGTRARRFLQKLIQKENVNP